MEMTKTVRASFFKTVSLIEVAVMVMGCKPNDRIL